MNTYRVSSPVSWRVDVPTPDTASFTFTNYLHSCSHWTALKFFSEALRILGYFMQVGRDIETEVQQTHLNFHQMYQLCFSDKISLTVYQTALRNLKNNCKMKTLFPTFISILNFQQLESNPYLCQSYIQTIHIKRSLKPSKMGYYL